MAWTPVGPGLSGVVSGVSATRVVSGVVRVSTSACGVSGPVTTPAPISSSVLPSASLTRGPDSSYLWGIVTCSGDIFETFGDSCDSGADFCGLGGEEDIVGLLEDVGVSLSVESQVTDLPPHRDGQL